MLCLIEFLDDTYQRKLRILSQGKSEQYEEAIQQYKEIFLAHLNYTKQSCTEKSCNSKKCEYHGACQVIKKEIESIAEEEISSFFERLRKIYIAWIDSRSIEAIEEFEKLLDEYKVLEFQSKIRKSDVFFKGRVTKEYLTRWDMFHIPFNKRHLIKNQRYSLTGQPIVYIGKSVIDVVEELETEDFENLKISTIQLPSDIKIFDLRNSIVDELIKIFIAWMFGEKETKYKKNSFYKLILASVCSFPKKQELKDFGFCEEYVLPQILAQIIKNQGFDGIMYQSTKKFANIGFKEETKEESKGTSRYIIRKNIDSEYKDNIALFTKINQNHVYDKELFDKLKISVPINISRIDFITMEQLDNIKEEINDCHIQEEINSADTIISSLNRIYNKMEYKSKEYYGTTIGQLHLYHLYEVLHQILISRKEGGNYGE